MTRRCRPLPNDGGEVSFTKAEEPIFIYLETIDVPYLLSYVGG